jgi:hypothetical protein
METVNVFWTSGYDSTFRVLDLTLHHEVLVQPWYVYDQNRPSAKQELKSMKRIRLELNKFDPGRACRLQPLQVRDLDLIPKSPKITAAYKALREAKVVAGSQYEYLAQLATFEDIEMEMGLKSDDRPMFHLLPFMEASEDAGRYKLEQGDGPLFDLFGRFRFPIYAVSKLEMKNIAEARGFSELLSYTWFCHTPLLGGSPCGWCGPCSHAKEEGFAERVPEATSSRRIARFASTRMRIICRRLGAALK